MQENDKTAGRYRARGNDYFYGNIWITTIIITIQMLLIILLIYDILNNDTTFRKSIRVFTNFYFYSNHYSQHYYCVPDKRWREMTTLRILPR